MRVIETALAGVLLLEHDVFADDRGFFYESYSRRTLETLGTPFDFVQDNISQSLKGVLRGLHYQLNPFAQGKVVATMVGEIFDVVVDLRRGSPTYGAWFGCVLSEQRKQSLWVPPGFAHGFCVLSDMAQVMYKATNFYSPPHERTIIWNDPIIGIEWPKVDREYLLSEKDKRGMSLSEAEINFVY